jgi:hypothetical protein
MIFGYGKMQCDKKKHQAILPEKAQLDARLLFCQKLNSFVEKAGMNGCFSHCISALITFT